MKSKFFTLQKRSLVVAICFLCMFLLCGCGSVHYSATVSSTGAVTLQLDLKFNKQELTKNLDLAGKDLIDFRSTVQSYARAVFNSAYNDFVDTLNDLAVDGVVETYGGKVPLEQVDQYVLKHTKFLSGNTWEINQNEISCVIALEFETYDAYRYFNGIFPATENDEDPNVQEFTKDYFFFAENHTVSHSVFNNIQSKPFTQYFVEYFNEIVDVDNMTFSYSYSTPSTKVYSDADKITIDAETGNTVHTWNFSTEKLKAGDGKITTYQVKIRAWVWYVLAILISVVVGSVLFVFAKVNERKQKKLAVANMQSFQQTSKEIRENNKRTLEFETQSHKKEDEND